MRSSVVPLHNPVIPYGPEAPDIFPDPGCVERSVIFYCRESKTCLLVEVEKLACNIKRKEEASQKDATVICLSPPFAPYTPPPPHRHPPPENVISHHVPIAVASGGARPWAAGPGREVPQPDQARVQQLRQRTPRPRLVRRYVSAPLVALFHFPTDDGSAGSDAPAYSAVFKSLPPPKPISKSTISQLFYDSLALSAWKTTGFSTWSLRVNPSSGNLHPTEAYVIAPPIDTVSISPFEAHYAPKEHSLEIRAQIPAGFFPEFFPQGSFLVGISSIFWREAWKYGERAFRYCNHDVGHAIGAVSMAAAGLGWDVKILDGLGHDDLEKLMGLQFFPRFKIPSRPVKGKLPDIEFEHPDCVLLVFPNGVGEFDVVPLSSDGEKN